MLIYRITNNINGKIYIGQTKRTLSKRIGDYRANLNRYKNRKRVDKYPVIMAMIKYGLENFTFEILEHQIITHLELDEKEIFYIKKYNSQDSSIGYNIQSGGKSGGSGRYKKLSEEQSEQVISLYLTSSVDQYNTINSIYDKIMTQFNCSRSTILRILNQNKIQLRRRVPTKSQREKLAQRNKNRQF